MLRCMSATRTQVYFTAAQRERLDERARAEGTTLAEVVRKAIDQYLAAQPTDEERDQALSEAFGACPAFGGDVPSRDEWGRVRD
jgi:hypothetical protein